MIYYDVETEFCTRSFGKCSSLSREEYFDVLDSVDIVLEAPMGCPAFVPEITFDRLLTSILTDAHLGTWFRVKDADDVAGTRPRQSG